MSPTRERHQGRLTGTSCEVLVEGELWKVTTPNVHRVPATFGGEPKGTIEGIPSVEYRFVKQWNVPFDGGEGILLIDGTSEVRVIILADGRLLPAG